LSALAVPAQTRAGDTVVHARTNAVVPPAVFGAVNTIKVAILGNRSPLAVASTSTKCDLLSSHV
jgi:hypothetical protein